MLNQANNFSMVKYFGKCDENLLCHDLICQQADAHVHQLKIVFKIFKEKDVIEFYQVVTI